MLVKKRSETLLKVILYVDISQKLIAKQLHSERTSWWVVFQQQIWIYWHETIYGGEPKERNVETGWMIFKHTERVDSIRKDNVETRLKWKWNAWY